MKVNSSPTNQALARLFGSMTPGDLYLDAAATWGWMQAYAIALILMRERMWPASPQSRCKSLWNSGGNLSYC